MRKHRRGNNLYLIYSNRRQTRSSYQGIIKIIHQLTCDFFRGDRKYHRMEEKGIRIKGGDNNILTNDSQNMLQIIPRQYHFIIFRFTGMFSVMQLLGVSTYVTLSYSKEYQGYLESVSPMTRNVKENGRVLQRKKLSSLHQKAQLIDKMTHACIQRFSVSHSIVQ